MLSIPSCETAVRLSSHHPPLRVIIASASSDTGKTTTCLAMAKKWLDAGKHVEIFKAGPDYLDASYHARLTQRPWGNNLDIWAMRHDLLVRRIRECPAQIILVEGVMGLFDGAAKGAGSTARLTQLLGWPLLMVISAGGSAQTLGAQALGLKLMAQREGLTIAAWIITQTRSQRHRSLIQEGFSLAHLNEKMIFLKSPRSLARQWLGLCPARQYNAQQWTELTNDWSSLISDDDLASLANVLRKTTLPPSSVGKPSPENHYPQKTSPPIDPLGQHIAVLTDDAFSFTYRHIVDGWREAGACVVEHNALDPHQRLPRHIDAVWCPGGFVELHAQQLSGNQSLREDLKRLASAGKLIVGECAGFMALGERLVDHEGRTWPMLGLLPVSFSMQNRLMDLGYCRAAIETNGHPLTQVQTVRGHVFHHGQLDSAPVSLQPMFDRVTMLSDSLRPPVSPLVELGRKGVRVGTVMGSFVHMIDRDPQPFT